MFDKPDAMHTVGLEQADSKIIGVRLQYRKGKPHLDNAFEVKIPAKKDAQDHVNPLYMEEGKKLKSLLNKSLAVTTLSTSEVLIRQMEVKLKKDSDIDAVLAFQAEPLLPYPSENAVVDRMRLSQNPEGTQLAVFAARKDHIQQHLDKWHEWHIEPEVVSCEPAALAAFSSLFFPTENIHAVIHVGNSTTTCVLVSQGKVLAAQACLKGISTLLKAYLKDKPESPSEGQDLFSALDFSAINREEYPALAETLENFRLELARIIYALGKQAKGKEVSEILLTGRMGTLNNLGQFLCKNLNKQIVLPAANPNFNLPVEDLQRLAIPIGSALTALPKSQEQINFRQNGLAYPNPWKRFKKPLMVYAVLCIALAVAFYFFGEAYLKYKESQIRIEYADLLEQMDKPYNDFEREYMAKTSGIKSDEAPIKNINELTQSDLIGRLAYLEKELQATPETYPLLPNTPMVSDVLGWLNKLAGATDKDNGEKALAQGIQIDSFSYTMVKRPEQTKKQEKYQVKVELEFSSPTPKMAREFHDALIAPNEMVDPKGEVKWSTNRGKYRTSFYLKDRTAYPSQIK